MASNDDNIDPQLREIKTEPTDTIIPLTGFDENETVNLLSDDEGDDTLMAPPNPRLGTPFQAQTPAPAQTPAESEGLFMDEGTPQANQNEHPEPEMTLQERTLAAQRKAAAMFLSRKQAASEAHALDTGSPDPEIPAEKPKSRKRKDAAAERFAKAKAAFERKRRAGTAQISDEIEFMRLEAAEQGRLRKLEADDEYDRPPSDEDDEDEALQNSPQHTAAPKAPNFSAMFSESDSEEEKPKKRKRGNNTDGRAKKSRKIVGTGVTEDDVDDVLERAKRATAKQAAGKKKGGKATAKAKTPAKRKATGAQMTNLNSIMGTDVFGDVAKTKNLPAQPNDFGSTVPGRRPDALKQLIASVPVESKKIAHQDKKYLDTAIKDFTGHATVKPAPDGNWRITGMKSTLKHYQVLGTAFMRRRENASEAPKGGILADQMGLGKTVMMIANIVNGKPKKTATQRATLIVASPALVSQWRREIEVHTLSNREHKQYGIGLVIQHRAGSRVDSNNNIDVLQQADIVLTTYHEVMKSYPKAVIPPHLVTHKQKEDWWREHYESSKGDLHKIKFLRVVLDEAQAIKNHKGHTSMACRALEAKYYWAITGTPILNTTKEFYPYFKFLREPNTGSYKVFKENFCSPDDPDGSEKLAVFLRKFMIRRTHLDTLFEARLLDLPPPSEHTLWLEFSDVERQIYEIVKKRFIQRINTIAKQENANAKKHHIWTMILRLRQLCSHPLLIQGTITDLLEREDFERLNKITESEDEMSEEGASLLVHLRHVLKKSAEVKNIEGGLQSAVITESETVPTGVIGEEGDSTAQTGGKHGLSMRFRKYLKALQDSEAWSAITERTLCTGCRQPPEDAQVTSCFHIYCQACLTDLQHLAARRGHDQARCSECGESYTEVRPCEGLDSFENRESTRETSLDALPQAAKKKSKKTVKNETDDWISMKGEILPSAKTQAVKAQVLNWLQDSPDCKTIIYTQFIPVTKILAKVCNTESWGFVKYTGEMSHEQREKAIQEFESKPECKIMLASLKCGGLGLNLTMASRVICLDPWWNQAIEQQAFCRVFRIGQQKETHMTRFVIKNTVDAAMMAMKERKQLEIDEVMQDNRSEKLTIPDLMRLFGKTGEDGDGKPFIFAQEDDEFDHPRAPNFDEEDENQMMGNDN